MENKEKKNNKRLANTPPIGNNEKKQVNVTTSEIDLNAMLREQRLVSAMSKTSISSKSSMSAFAKENTFGG